MKLADVVRSCTDSLKNVALKYDKNEIDPSFMSNTLAYIVDLYKEKVIDDNTITGLNNPTGIIDPQTGQMKNFSTMEEGFIMFKESYYDSLNFEEEELQKIIKSFNLHRFDKEVLGLTGGNIIDLPEEKCEPMVDVYKVEKRDKTIGVATDMNEAKKMKEKNPGSVIKNSRGNIVGDIKKAASKKVLSLKYEAGTKVVCEGINLYLKFKDTTPSRVINGEYYMYDGKIVQGRIAICKKPEFIGDSKNIIGFIRISDLVK